MSAAHPNDDGPSSAVRLLGEARAALPHAAAFRTLPADQRDALAGRLDRVRQALVAGPHALARQADPYDTDLLARPLAGSITGYGGYSDFGAAPAAPPTDQTPAEPRSLLRTVGELPAAAGAMAEELGFADFVASLVHGTFDAIVDSTIRQMEAFASLVASLAQTVDAFSRDNVSTNQVRDWLVETYPADLQLVLPSAEGEQPRVVPRATGDDWGASPDWLADYDLAGEELDETLIETRVIPQARLRIGEERMRTLAAMTLIGMNRVRVDRGEISARVRIRAKASDAARVGFAQDQDTGGAAGGRGSWTGRAGFTPPAAQAMVSTAVNAQSDAAIAAELQGEVKVVFSSDVVPLESFVSDAQRVLLERTARTRQGGLPAAPPAPTPAQVAQDAVTRAVPSRPAPAAAPQPAGDGT